MGLWVINMHSLFNIDETDVKILQALIRGTSSKLKDIANDYEYHPLQ